MGKDGKRPDFELARRQLSERMGQARQRMADASADFRRSMEEARLQLETIMSDAKADMDEAHKDFEASVQAFNRK